MPGWLLQWDHKLFWAVNHGWRGSELDWLAPVLGQLLPLAPILAAAAWLVVSRHPRRWQALTGLLCLFIFTDFTISHILRPYFGLARPFAALEGVYHWSQEQWIVSGPIQGADLSLGFPSAHAANALGAAVFLWRFLPRWRLTLAGLAVVAALARVYCGLHFPSDVLAGLAWGAFWGWTLGTAVERLGPGLQKKLAAMRLSQGVILALIPLGMTLVFVLVPGLNDRWLEVLTDYHQAVLRMIHGQWIIAPGGGTAQSMTPLAALLGWWLGWLTTGWAAVALSAAHTMVLAATLLMIHRVLDCPPLDRDWLAGVALASGGLFSLYWFGPTSLWGLSATVCGLALVRSGRLAWGGAAWGVAAALQPPALALAFLLGLRMEWRALAVMLATAAAAFCLPDLLVTPQAGGWFAADYFSHNLLHLSWMDQFVSNLPSVPRQAWPASGSGMWAAEFFQRSWPWEDLLSAGTLQLLVIPGFALAGAWWWSARSMCAGSSWSSASAAALAWGVALFPGTAPCALGLLVLPALATSTTLTIGSDSHGRAAQLGWIGLGIASGAMLVGLSGELSDLTGWRWLDSLPFVAYPLGLLIALKPGATPAKPATSPAQSEAKCRAAAMCLGLVVLVVVSAVWWEAEYRGFKREAAALQASLTEWSQGQGNNSELPAPGPIEYFGALASSSWPSRAHQGAAGVELEFYRRWNAAYLVGGEDRQSIWVVLWYPGPGSRHASTAPAWSEEHRRSFGRGQLIPGMSARMWVVSLGAKLSPSPGPPGPFYQPGLVWRRGVVPGVEPAALGTGGLSPCRARLVDGVHLGQLQKDGCAIGWGGVTLLAAEYEVLFGQNPAPNYPHYHFLEYLPVQGGMTPHFGYQAVCSAQYKGRTWTGKQQQGRCHVAQDKRELGIDEYRLLGCPDMWSKYSVSAAWR